MREAWKMPYFTAESGYAAARRLQRRMAASATVPAPAPERAKAAGAPFAGWRPAIAR